MPVTETIYARNTVSMTDLRRNPSEVIEVANLAPVAVLNHNKPAAYLISAASIFASGAFLNSSLHSAEQKPITLSL